MKLSTILLGLAVGAAVIVCMYRTQETFVLGGQEMGYNQTWTGGPDWDGNRGWGGGHSGADWGTNPGGPAEPNGWDYEGDRRGWTDGGRTR